MLSDKYNYSLNGINHEIILNNNLKIDKCPINDKILVSNKYIIKYINDLFEYISIEYCFVGDSLLGIYVFNGINIFSLLLEICISDNNFYKIKKYENDIKNDGFEIYIKDNYIKILGSFFNKNKTIIYIYPLVSEPDKDILKYTTINNLNIIHEFYDIFPIKKNIFEDFEVSIPNKIDKVLKSYNFNLNYINFSNNNYENKIIEEIEKKEEKQSLFTSIINYINY